MGGGGIGCREYRWATAGHGGSDDGSCVPVDGSSLRVRVRAFRRRFVCSGRRFGTFRDGSAPRGTYRRGSCRIVGANCRTVVVYDEPSRSVPRGARVNTRKACAPAAAMFAPGSAWGAALEALDSAESPPSQTTATATRELLDPGDSNESSATNGHELENVPVGPRRSRVRPRRPRRPENDPGPAKTSSCARDPPECGGFGADEVVFDRRGALEYDLVGPKTSSQALERPRPAVRVRPCAPENDLADPKTISHTRGRPPPRSPNPNHHTRKHEEPGLPVRCIRPRSSANR